MYIQFIFRIQAKTHYIQQSPGSSPGPGLPQVRSPTHSVGSKRAWAGLGRAQIRRAGLGFGLEAEPSTSLGRVRPLGGSWAGGTVYTRAGAAGQESRSGGGACRAAVPVM
ncbi:hypothetical protein JB92DRAFT_2829823 [Gautieria morchelliformis]|nr:hypothetical protein JB92DRAFT_2829823 [Gautieria morchelliformis]